MNSIDDLAHLDNKSKLGKVGYVLGRMALGAMIFCSPLFIYKSCQTYELKNVEVASKQNYTIESTGFTFDGFARNKYHDISEITVTGYDGCFRGKELFDLKTGDYIEKLVFKKKIFSECEEVIEINKPLYSSEIFIK